MNREFKFRVWHKLGNCFLVNPLIIFSPEDGGIIMAQVSECGDNYGAGQFSRHQFYTSENIIIQQYTGFKDKNGCEIYEGDLIKVGNGNWSVYWNKSCWQPITDMFFDGCKEKDFEVIGNIFENPELIK